MLVLSALCVLLPLAAALDTCDDKTAKAFLAKKKQDGDLLQNFGGKMYWVAASPTEGTDSSVYSVAVKFDEVIKDSVQVHFVYRNTYGNQTDYESSTYTLEGDNISAHEKQLFLYFFPCSNNLIAGYRCAVTGFTASGPKYFIWAVKDITDAQVSGELPACKKQITNMDKTVDLTDRHRPIKY